MDIFLFIAAGLLMVIGLIGTVVPGIPGGPCSYLGLLLVHFTSKVEYSYEFLILTFIACVVVFLLDFFVPAWCTKQFGGSKKGVWGSIIGLVVGIIAPIPFGFIIGPFVGAVIGELIDGKDTKGALSSGVGSFIGFILSTGAKLALGLVFTYYYIEAVYSSIKGMDVTLPQLFS
ncbi:MAG: DUF456 domain-containing protein [Paludibacteraceae bacterium]|nr:DUF456 domain-containing protein [Paludibacteraceae bacterium]